MCVLRIIPVIVVCYRYLMVCHSGFCREKGEKKIHLVLLRACLWVPFVVGFLCMVYMNDLQPGLMCTRREEVVRFNLDDFYGNVEYPNKLFLVPLFHPFKLVCLFIGEFRNHHKMKLTLFLAS